MRFLLLPDYAISYEIWFKLPSESIGSAAASRQRIKREK